MKFANKEERERYIVDFIGKLVDNCATNTVEDRDRWKENQKFFRGEVSPTPMGGKDKFAWMSNPNLPEYSSLIRRIATMVQDLIFEDPDFFDFEADKDRGGVVELERILKNIVRYYLNDVDFERSTYQYCLIGGIYGIAISKLSVEAKAEWRPEVVIREIEKQEQADRESLGKDVEGLEDYEIPESPDLLLGRLETELDAVLGEKRIRPRERNIEAKKRLRFAINLNFPNPLNFYYDTDAVDVNQSPYHIERIYTRFYNIVDKFETGDFDKSKKEQVKQVIGKTNNSTPLDANSSYEEQKISQQGQFVGTAEFMPVLEVIEYFGHLYDEVGDIIEENKHFVVINKKVLVKDKTNPYYSQESPYRVSCFSPVPFKPVGVGAGDSLKSMNELINDLLGSWMDLVRLAVYQPLVGDKSKLSDETQLDNYVQPGQILDTDGSDVSNVFHPIPINLNVAAPLFQTIEKLQLSGEKGASVDTTSSNPASRARITAQEIQSNLGRATQSILTLGRELDANYLIPTIERLVDYVLQFAFSLDVLADLKDAGIISDSEFQLVAGIPKIERYNELKRNYKIKVRGFRARLENQEFLRKINEAVSVMSKMPPQVIEKIQWSELLRQYFRAFGFDPDKFISQNTPMDKAREENFILKNEQMVAIGQADDDVAELPIHYEGLLSGATQAMVAHTIAHMQRAMQVTGGFPPPPPAVAEILGMNEPAEPAGPEQETMQ